MQDPVYSMQKRGLLLVVVAACSVSPFLVFSLLEGAGFHDNQRLIEWVVVVLGCLVVAGHLAWPQRVTAGVFKPLQWPLAAFFLLGLVSSVLSYSPRHALFEWANLLALLAVAWLIACELAAQRNDVLLDRVLLLCGLGCALYAFGALLVCISVVKVGGQPPPSLVIFGFDNYRFFNHTQTVSLPLLGLLAVRTQDRARRFFWWTIVAFWGMLLFVSAGRGTMLGLLAGLGVTWLVLPQKAVRRWCLSMLAAGIAGFLMYLLLYVAVPMAQGLQPYGLFSTAVERSMANPSNGRMVLWQRAWEMVVAHPWLGSGPLHFAHAGRDLQAAAHPHNWLLQIGSEWGVPALLCLAGALMLALLQLWRARTAVAPGDAMRQCTLAVWMVTAIAIVLDGMVSGLLVMPTSQLWIALYLGCAWGWVAGLTPGAAALAWRPSAVSRAGVVVVAGLLLVALGRGIWPEVANIPQHEAQNLRKDLYPDAVHAPRILRAGHF